MKLHVFPPLSLIAILVVACGGSEPAATQAPAASAAPTPTAALRPKPSEPAVAGMDAVLAAYLDEADHLASDSYATESAAKLKAAVEAVKVEPSPAWLGDLQTAATVYAAAADLTASRRAFDALSIILIEYAEAHETTGTLHLVHCPMAPAQFGGSWLQRGDTVRNPWYGAGMLTCGVKKW